MSKPEAEKEWTWQEINEHNTRQSCWLYVERDVYDVTKWLPKHPGGDELILLFAGRDCTESFRAYHPFTDKPYQILEKFKIGKLKGPSELVRWKPDSGFYKAIRERSAKYFKDNNIDPVKQTNVYEFFRFLTSIGFFLFGQFVVTKKMGDWGVPFFYRILSTLFLAFFAIMIVVNVGHMASHVPAYHKPKLNTFIGWLSFDFCAGVSFHIWLHEHIVGHHQYTNIITIDPNAPETHDNDALYRSSPNQNWYKRFASQYIWLPLISFLLITEYRMASFRFFLKGFRKEIRANPEFLNLKTFLIFLVGKFLWFWRVYYVPVAYWNCRFIEVVTLNFFAELFAGYFIGITFPANHITNKVDWPMIEKNEKTGELSINEEWAVMQAKTCKDYSPQSWIFTHAFGSLNNHSCHHLFPAMHHSYYSHIYPIVHQAAKEYNVKLPHVGNYFELVGDYLKNLWDLGYDPKKLM